MLSFDTSSTISTAEPGASPCHKYKQAKTKGELDYATKRILSPIIHPNIRHFTLTRNTENPSSCQTHPFHFTHTLHELLIYLNSFNSPITNHAITARSKFKLDELCSQSQTMHRSYSFDWCILKELWTYVSDRLETPWKRWITAPPAAQWSWIEHAAGGNSWNYKARHR